MNPAKSSARFAGAVDLDDRPAILLQPRIAQRVPGCADRNYLAAEAQDGAIFDDIQFLQIRTATRIPADRRTAKREKLADVG